MMIISTGADDTATALKCRCAEVDKARVPNTDPGSHGILIEREELDNLGL